jgi:thioredoxin reductase (NADPH)
LSNSRVETTYESARTSREGIWAIGDCIEYPHKRKLILSGFAEAAQAAQDIYKYINPGASLIIGHSTTLGIPK